MDPECGTFSQFVQTSVQDVMAIHVHVVSLPSKNGSKPRAWFADKENRELLSLVYDIWCSRDAAVLEASDYQFKYSMGKNLRILFKFMKAESRQHLVIPQDTRSYSGLIPQAMFVSDEGRKVLPFLNQRTQGSGYRPFRVLDSCMEVYVDNLSVSESRGIFQFKGRLNSRSKFGLDLRSFLEPPSAVGSAIDGVCSLAEIPRAALRPGKRGRGKGKGKGRSGGTPGKGGSRAALKDRSNAGSLKEERRRGRHLGIKDFLKPTSSSKGCGNNPRDPAPSTAECVDLTEEALEDFCNFSNDVPTTSSGSVQDSNETPPLSPGMAEDGADSTPLSPNGSGHMDCSDGTVQERSPSPFPARAVIMRPDEGANISGLSGLSNISTPDVSYLFDSSRLPPDCTPSVPDSTPSVPAKTPACGSNLCSKDIIDLLEGEDADAMETASTVTSASSISDVISILSSGEESEGEGGSGSCGGNTDMPRSAKKRVKLRSTKEIVKGTSCVAELTLQQVREWMYFSKPLLVNIFKRTEFSQRHEDFYSGAKKRQAIKYELDTRMFKKEHVQLVTSLLLHIFCGRNMKYFSYVMSVLLPECMIRILADVNGISYTNAEKMLVN